MIFLPQALIEVCTNKRTIKLHHMLCVALVTCREILGLPANEVVEVAPEKYPRYEV